MPLMEGVGTTPQSSSGDGEAEVFGCIREVVDDVLWDFLCVGEKGAVISKQQLSDEFLDGFRVCEETLEVEETSICSEMDVDAIWQVLFCLTEHDVTDGEQRGGQDAYLLDPIGDGETDR